MTFTNMSVASKRKPFGRRRHPCGAPVVRYDHKLQEWSEELSADLLEATWPQDWGRLLRLARQVAGLSLSELSARTGLSKGYLSKLESGHLSAQNPSRATLAALARTLPSFRPLANTLEPGAALAALDFGTEQSFATERIDTPEDKTEKPVRLGWRELELLVALLALDAAALPVPLTSALLARAIDRGHAETLVTLAGLVTMGAVEREWPQRPGAPMAYRPAARAIALTGLERVGDALVLGASLLAQAPARPRRASDADRFE
jgi:transcriptional regulator with XRE-family HTH domain